MFWLDTECDSRLCEKINCLITHEETGFCLSHVKHKRLCFFSGHYHHSYNILILTDQRL